MKLVYDDGGRAAAGFKGRTNDCACRSIAIVTGRAYREIYDELNILTSYTRKECRGYSARRGIPASILRRYLRRLEFNWTATMRIGSGCRVHLRAEELPPGRLLVQCSHHMTAVIDGVVHDTHDPTRSETRCVYGFWSKPAS